MVEKLKPLVPSGYTLPQLALRWCLDHPAVTTIIPGARNRAQALANATASDLAPLPADTHTKLRDFFVSTVKPAVRGPDLRITLATGQPEFVAFHQDCEKFHKVALLA